MSRIVPAPIARRLKIDQLVNQLDGIAVVCAIIPFEFRSDVAREDRFREHVLYAGHALPAHIAEDRASMFEHHGVQAFAARVTPSNVSILVPHIRRASFHPASEIDYFQVKFPGRYSRGRDISPEYMTLAQALGFLSFNQEYLDRLGNPWFLRHLRREAEPVPLPPEFSF